MPKARTSASCARRRSSSKRGLARPILVGRPAVVETRLERFGLSIRPGRDFTLVNPDDDPRYRDYVQTYREVAGRRGITPDAARTLVRTNATVIAQRSRCGAARPTRMLCGVEGRYMSHLRHIRDIIGLLPGVRGFRSAVARDHVARSVFPGRYAGAARSEPPRKSPNMAVLRGDACPPLRADSRRSRCCRIPISAAIDSAIGPQDAAALRELRDKLSRNRSRRRDARRHGAEPELSATSVFPNSAAEGRGQCADHAAISTPANIAYQMTKMHRRTRCRWGPILIGPAQVRRIS